MAYEDLAGPLGPRRADIHTGLIVQALHGLSGKKTELKEVVPTWGETGEQTLEEQLATVEQLNRQFGGEDLRGHDRVPDGPPGS